MRPATLVVLLVIGCKPPPEPCNGADLSTDSANCGVCGMACGAGSRCEDGQCIATCAGLRCAGDVCVDSQSDPSNCGACGVVCGSNHAPGVCIAGACSHGPCEAGWFDCDGDPRNGCENDSYHCVIEVCGRTSAGRPRSCTPLSMSADGKRVLFHSIERDYVAGDDSSSRDFFLFEVPTRTYRRVMQVPPLGYPRSGALSGDGTRVAMVVGDALSVLDLETGQFLATPQLPTRDMNGDVIHVDPAGASLSYDGRQMVCGLATGDFGRRFYGCVVPTEGGEALLVPTENLIQLSGNGRFAGVGRIFEDGGAVDPVIVDLDAGTLRRLAKQLPLPVGNVSPVLSFDGTVGAFTTYDPAFALPGDDAGMLPRAVVFGADGGVLFSMPGTGPSLSYDGRRLGFVPYFSQYEGCQVVDVETREVLLRSQTVLPMMSYCFLSISGNGRWALVTFDQFTGESLGYLVPLPPQ